MTLSTTTQTELRVLLREEVGRFRQQQRLRRFGAILHLGHPAGVRVSLPLPADRLDPGLRIDLAARLLERAPDEAAYGWLTRPGTPVTGDADLDWLAAAAMAFALHGRELRGFWAVTRTGWLDVRNGEARVWRRLRL